MWKALTLAAGLALAAPVAAQDGRDGIEGVIASQLDAFTARDVGTAWTFASPTIQGIFGTPENFGRMVRGGYPMVWDNADVRFLDKTEAAGAVIQRVLIRDAEGVAHVLDYEMVETASGWVINGVRIVPAPDVGA